MIARAFAMAAALTCLSSAALAGTTGTIQGRVFDRQGNALPNAVISLHSERRSAQTRSDGHGFYHFLSLYPERYYIVFTRGGNMTLTSEISVHADQVTVCNARLNVALTGLYSTRARDNNVVPCSF
jgi:protocatechuate 3,4-dioxygenase beta subunit